MRLSPILTGIAALIAVLVFGYIGLRVVNPNRPLLASATLSLSEITPNGDGNNDVTEILYSLSSNAKVTISFKNQATGQTFYFRKAEDRPAGDFSVLFSGIVDGYTLPGDQPGGTIETRLIPNGDYAWAIQAERDDGEKGEIDGTLTVANADLALPAIQDFSVSPKTFTPNQDGIDDRVAINVYLAKAATLTVYLQGQDGKKYYIAERDEGRTPGEPGAHFLDYDGGVDQNITPPPNGTYTLIATAQDKEGQIITRQDELTIADSGLPYAEIAPQGTGCMVCFSTMPYQDSYFTDKTTQGQRIDLPQDIKVQSVQAMISMPQGDLLFFRLTVSNYGVTPLRTIGPWPGTVYDYTQTHGAMPEDYVAKSGAWRVGIECEQSESSYPWRWAIGSQDQLQQVKAANGDVYWYLPAGDSTHPRQAVVWGAIRMTQIYPSRNPQLCYAALIHEDVDIPNLQNDLGPIKVELIPK